jgi:isopenicillin N synthase-like dioxygenase
MVNELLDDGTVLEGNDSQGPVSMSSHRLSQYRNIKKNASDEVFGAHTDSSFVTVVPVAAVSGLEVYDDEAEKWYRPEMKAREVWEAEREKNGEDPNAQVEIIKGADGDDVEIPWHARYLVVLPGEFLQIVSRNEIVAAVHREVAGSPDRLSAPVLVRGRPGVPLDAKRYLGQINDKLLEQVDGLSTQQILDALQPSSFQ